MYPFSPNFESKTVADLKQIYEQVVFRNLFFFFLLSLALKTVKERLGLSAGLISVTQTGKNLSMMEISLDYTEVKHSSDWFYS